MMAETVQVREAHEIGGKAYRLRYSIGRLEQIELATGTSAVSMVMGLQTQKFPPISTVRQYFAMGLIDDGGVYAPVKLATDYASTRMEGKGYLDLAMAVMQALAEDCGFLFQTA